MRSNDTASDHLPAGHVTLFVWLCDQHGPEALPTGLLAREHSQYVRTIVAALRNTGYYDIRPFASEEAAERGLAEGEVLFVINVPPNFERSVDRGETLGRAWSAGGEEHSECPIRPIPNTARSPCLLRRKRRETPRLSFFKRPPSRRLFSRSCGLLRSAVIWRG